MTEENTGVASSDLPSVESGLKSLPFIVFKANQEPPIFTISKVQGTVGIEIDPTYLRTLMLTRQEGKEAYSVLLESAKTHGVNLDYFHQALHDLVEGAINAFHRDVYANAQRNHSPDPSAMVEAPHVG